MNFRPKRELQGWLLVSAATISGLLGVTNLLPFFTALLLSSLALALAATGARGAGPKLPVLYVAAFTAAMGGAYLLLVVLG